MAYPYFRDEIKVFVTWNSLLVLNVSSYLPNSVSLGWEKREKTLYSLCLVLSLNPARLGFASVLGTLSQGLGSQWFQ